MTAVSAAPGVWLQACPEQQRQQHDQGKCRYPVALRDACKAADGAACAALGLCLARGWHIGTNAAKAKTLFTHACRLGDARGCRFAGSLLKACKLRDRRACVRLAAAKLAAQGPPAHRRHASLLRASCRDGHSPSACRHLGLAAWARAGGAAAPMQQPGSPPTSEPTSDGVIAANWLVQGCRLCDLRACVAASGVLRASFDQFKQLKAQALSEEMAARACLLGHRPACASGE